MTDIPRFVPADVTPDELRKILGTIGTDPPPASVPPAPAQASAPTPTPATPVPQAQPAATAAVATPVQVEMDIPATTWVPPEEQTPQEYAEVQRMASNVTLAFPAIGFIDPAVELEKMLRITQRMQIDEKQAYPEKIRAAILAHEAGKGPEVSDEDLALAIFIQRTTYIPLSEEELEAKATGKKKREPGEPRAKKISKKAASSIDQLTDLGI